MLLQDFVRKTAEKYPGKKAIVLNSGFITYKELDEQSGSLANLLALKRAKPGTNIGIYLQKSIEAVVAIMGILKAGCVYVPLDPDSPAERISYIIKNSNIHCLVTDAPRIRRIARLIKTQPELFSPELTLVNLQPVPVQDILPGWNIIEREQIMSCPATYTPPDITGDDPAYILYTSGSTGYPKGVMLSHNNATVFVEWAAGYFRLSPSDIFSSHAPFHFDLSIFDIFACMRCGGTLCLIPAGMGYFPDALLEYIYANRITVWYSVPSALIQFLNLQDDVKKKLASLTRIIYAGEVFPYKYLNHLRAFLTDCGVYNLYGPTETNVITFKQVEFPSPGRLAGDVPIGKACPYAGIAIVDEDGQLAQKGSTGELIVNGLSLMSGYYNDREKTAAAVRRVTINGKQDYFYFTGDMVFENEDADLVYVGRRDSMLKIRGFRVELGEIEAVLYKNEKVVTAAIIAVQDGQIGNRILAFVEQEKQAGLTAEILSGFLGRYLPVYMIPSDFIFVENFPRTSTGKIDKQELKKNYLTDKNT